MTTHSDKFVDERSSNSKMRQIHLVYEKYVILAMQISSHNQKYFKNCKSEFLLGKIAKKCGELTHAVFINFRRTHSYTKYTVIR
jgi:hypothetical protein